MTTHGETPAYTSRAAYLDQIRSHVVANRAFSMWCQIRGTVLQYFRTGYSYEGCEQKSISILE